MKKALLTIAVVIAGLSVQAQNIRVGLTGGVNSTWLMNKNVFDADDELDIAASFGGRLGIEGIYSFNDKTGLSLGFNFISTHNQKYTGESSSGNVSYDVTEHLKYFDIPLLFRLTSSSGTYFEVGPQFGFLTSATEDFETSPSSPFDYEGDEHDGSYENMNIAVILGFGVDIDVTENIFITAGLRLGYGLSDVTTEYGSAAELAAADNMDEISYPNYWAHYENANTQNGDQFSYEKTSRVFGGLNLGVSYKFGGTSAK